MSLMGLLLDSTIKISLILLLALAGCALLRRRSASVRHWLLSAAIACAAITPALTLVMPPWRLPIDIDTSTVTTPAEQVRAETHVSPLQQAHQTPMGRTSAATATSTAISRSTSLSTTSASAFVLRAIWLPGVAISLLLLIAGFARLAAIASRAQRVRDANWLDITNVIARRHGLRRQVVLLQSHHPALLATWGWLRPKVLLPAAAQDWTDHRIRIVLSHELAHVRRGDWPLQMLAEVLRSMYWFNPLLWIVCRRLRHESERACDDEVMGLGVEGAEYAEHVVDLARAFGAHRRAAIAPPALAMARSSGLERRIRAMLDGHIDRQPITRRTRLAMVGALATFTILVAGISAANVQTSGARFSGSVVDITGAGIANATVVLTSLETDTSQLATSDQDGRFHIELPAGHYILKTTAQGFAPLQDTEVDLAAGRHMQRNITLQLGAVRETITLTASNTPGTLPRQLYGTPDPEVEAKIKAFRNRSHNDAIQPPTKLKDVKPVYPKAARSAGLQETVIVEARIATDGSVTDAHALSPMNPELGEAAVEAVRGWQYRPTLLHGVPVETQMTVSIDFRLDQ